MKVIVYHSGYGCDTGCCGHVVEIEGTDREHFSFSHPYGEDHLQFAKDLVRDELGEKHVADLDWDECLILED